eukprot:1627241-Prymnesium_polylepis.1
MACVADPHHQTPPHTHVSPQRGGLADGLALALAYCITLRIGMDYDRVSGRRSLPCCRRIGGPAPTRSGSPLPFT